MSQEVDCAARLKACKAACCKLYRVPGITEATVSVELRTSWVGADRHSPRGEIVARKVKRVPRCPHLSPEDRCTVYDERPWSCRQYSCEANKNIWLDFDSRIANPRLDEYIADGIPM